MNPAGAALPDAIDAAWSDPKLANWSGQRHLARHGRCGPAEWAALVFSIDGLVADA